MAYAKTFAGKDLIMAVLTYVKNVDQPSGDLVGKLTEDGEVEVWVESPKDPSLN